MSLFIEILDKIALADKIILYAIGASPSGKAPVFGTGIQRFESFRPRVIVQLSPSDNMSKGFLYS